MGIFFGIVFIVWFLSGMIFVYVGMPNVSTREKLGHVPPIDLSTARFSPAEAAEKNNLDTGRLKIEMFYDGRPIYRFGNTKIYADSGEPVPGVNALQALDVIRKWAPQYASTVKYDGYLEDSDQWTLQQAQRQFMPLHRISIGDPAGTNYYVSEGTGEIVMKTDARGRFWGWWSAVLHWTYFTPFRRHTELWDFVITWGSIVGALMCLGGMIIGVWRLSPSRRFRIKGEKAYSPYSGWMWWHHYAGLVFGFLSFTWAFSGALSLGPFQSLRQGPVTQEQRRAVAGQRITMENLTLDRLRAALAVFAPKFTPKDMEFLQFRGEPYFIGYAPPGAYNYADEIGANAERIERVREHLIVSALHPERGSFTRFDDEAMEKIAQEAMPGVEVVDSVWLREYDNYYYNQNGERALPVLRVRYNDPKATWLYLDPFHGAMLKQERGSRWNRWLYKGFHDLDFPFLYYSRPLWDIVIIVFSLGGTALAATTLVPSYRRLVRHAKRFGKYVIRMSSSKRAPQIPVSGD